MTRNNVLLLLLMTCFAAGNFLFARGVISYLINNVNYDFCAHVCTYKDRVYDCWFKEADYVLSTSIGTCARFHYVGYPATWFIWAIRNYRSVSERELITLWSVLHTILVPSGILVSSAQSAPFEASDLIAILVITVAYYLFQIRFG